MEQLIGRAKFPAKCVKNEIHNILTTLRLTRPTHGINGTEAKFHLESLKSFQRLFEELTYIHELHEFDIVAYLGPFLEVIQSEATSGELTAVALEAVDKFVSFGLIHPDSPRCTEAINTLAWGVINCRFLSDGSASDEVVLLKMVGLLIDCLRCPAGEYLSDPMVWHMVKKCFQISRQPTATHLLRSSAEGMLQQMVLTIFGTQKERSQRIRVRELPEAATAQSAQPLQVYKPYGFRAMHFVLRFLAFLLAYGRSAPQGAKAKAEPKLKKVRRPRSRSPSSERRTGTPRSNDGSSDQESPPDLGLTDAAAAGKEDLVVDTHCLGLSLLNVALESGGDEIARSDELIGVIQDDICKSLLHNSRTASLNVLSLSLRAIFNLFLHFKRHLKVQLEIFFTSVHLKIAGCGTATYEQRELALESLLEFCREPALMLELYENYDCDVRCTNLFETLVKFLVTGAAPPKEGQARGAFNSLNKLALSGLLSILHSLSLRCESHKHFRIGDVAVDRGPSTPTSGETELQRKKEQKRRLTIAARTFNSEPSKSTAALQSLGLLSNPVTPESFAEFLRHTPGLDMVIVGEYLGKRHDFNGQVRKAFLETFPFPGLGLVEALRMVLATFRLPGEAQCIDRLMEAYAEAYFRAQLPVAESAGEDPLKVTRWIPRERSGEEAPLARQTAGGPEDAAGEEPSRVPMSSSDTIFVLAFSIIMLNTDLHNPGVKKKMSFEEFVRNNRGIDSGKDMPAYFLRDIYEAIRDDEIRLHGDAPPEGGDEQVIDDFFWEGILLRSESIDAFASTERLLSEAPPTTTERDMLQVITDCEPLPVLTHCYECVPDAGVALQAMTGFQDLARIGAYFDNVELVSSLVRSILSSCAGAAAFSGGAVTVRCQIALGASEKCVGHFASLFREAEWRGALDVMLQLWAMDLLPSHLSEFDDFSGTDGKPLESLCNIRPLFPPPAVRQDNDPSHHAGDARRSDAKAAAADSGDGFLESLARWFEDETRDDEEEEASDGRLKDDLIGTHFGARPGGDASDAEVEALPVNCTDPGLVHQKVKAYVARSGFVEVLGATGIAKVSPESLQCLAKALVQLSKPSRWVSQGQSPTTAEPADEVQAGRASWHDVADPVFCLELLTNLTCTPLPASHCLSHIWPLVSTHFEKLLQYVIAGNGLSEMQFIERLIVNTLRLCIRLIGNSELVPTLLLLTQHLSRLPAQHFAAHAERIACGTLVLVQEANLPHSGLCNIFTLLRRISEFPAGVGACSASIECLNFWLSDDQELSRLLSLQQFPELLRTLKAFASQNSTPASATALSHLSTLVPQMARGARSLPVEAQSQWRSLWVPTLQALADIARDGSQRCSAQAFVYLQRLLLECGTDLALPWEQLEFNAWKECLEQVLVPLLQSHPAEGADGAALTPGSQEAAATRQANAAQLVCRVLLTHMPSWLRSSPDGFPVLFLRILHVLVSEATTETAKLPLVESLKNLLLVISADPAFGELPSPKQGETLLEAAWGVVSPALPELRREVQLILDPSAEDRAPEEVAEAGAAKTDEPA